MNMFCWHRKIVLFRLICDNSSGCWGFPDKDFMGNCVAQRSYLINTVWVIRIVGINNYFLTDKGIIYIANIYRSDIHADTAKYRAPYPINQNNAFVRQSSVNSIIIPCRQNPYFDISGIMMEL